MKPVLTADMMKACDSACIASGTPSETLMERAADSICSLLREHFDTTRVIAVCGRGNNGGDGILAAVKLFLSGTDCSIFLAADGDEHRSAENAKALEKAKKCGVPFTTDNDFSQYTAVIDAVFGIGLKNEPRGAALEAIKAVNRSGVSVLSADIPSGLCADTGKILGEAVKADVTAAIETYKTGLLRSDGIDRSGKVQVCPIGIPTDIESENIPLAVERNDMKCISRRPLDANKGTFGRVLVIGGGRGMSGAAYLSAKSSYRSGAGLVEIFTCEDNRSVLQALLPEAIVTAYKDEEEALRLLPQRLATASTVTIGPGLSKSSAARLLVAAAFEQCRVPITADADALNIAAEEKMKFPVSVPVIITPHPGEMSRLCGMSIADILLNPVDSARTYAAEHGVICVLKTARTVLSDGRHTSINTSGSPALAKGGSGDVLTGVIAGMLCAGLSPIKAATAGVYIHGAAGEKAEEEFGAYSPLAGEVCDCVGKVLKELGNR